MRRQPPSSQVDWGRGQAPYPQLGNQDLPSKFASQLHRRGRAVPRIVHGTRCALLLLVAAKRGPLAAARLARPRLAAAAAGRWQKIGRRSDPPPRSCRVGSDPRPHALTVIVTSYPGRGPARVTVLARPRALCKSALRAPKRPGPHSSHKAQHYKNNAARHRPYSSASHRSSHFRQFNEAGCWTTAWRHGR